MSFLPPLTTLILKMILPHLNPGTVFEIKIKIPVAADIKPYPRQTNIGPPPPVDF
jgi:hypothetical protein